MTQTLLFKEARRLWKLGFAVHWLHPKSKRPIESKWTTGPRKDWEYLSETYLEGFNLGVRTGEASKIAGRGYLACIDVDIKNPLAMPKAMQKLKELLGDLKCPEVRSGSGNGSRHLYCVTEKPFKMITFWKEKDLGEICIYSEGRQMALPPSIHPDTGKTYHWKKAIESARDLPLMEFKEPADNDVTEAKVAADKVSFDGFQVEEVELDWLPISKEIRDGIKNGTGVSDRSGYMLRASSALLSAGLTQNEVLSVLTEPSYYLGACGYDHAKTTSRKRAAEWVYRYTLKKVSEERSAVGLFSKASEVVEKKLTPEEVETQSQEFAEARNWRQDLQMNNGIPKGTIENVVIVLTNAVNPELVRRDRFSFRDIYGCKTPWGGVEGSSMGDDDTAQIRLWLGENFKFEPKKDTVNDALTNIACRNSFDPVQDWLEALPEWDGQPRLDSWLADNFGAEGESEYLAQVFRKWMVAMVLRVYEPGAKFDWMPIFEGAQGVGKSSFGRLLCGDKVFLDWLPNLADKDAALGLQGMWVVEMGELSQFRKNELEVIKGFITRTVDKVRPPFGRRWVESPRRCVFFGTTNREKYLRDDTGNRRLKPVKVGSLNFRALRRDRLQLFCEAKHLYMKKIETAETLDLTGSARIFEAKMHSEKMVEDDAHAMLEVLRNFLERLRNEPELGENFDLSKFGIADLFTGIGPLIRWRFDNRNMQFAAKALKMAGGEKWKSDGRIVWKLTNRDRLTSRPIPRQNLVESFI
jgi:hypothetical protein